MGARATFSPSPSHFFAPAMKASNPLWKSLTQGRIAEPLASELDQFESEITLRKQGKIDEKVFAETRLRRGAYGQRYDNGQRHDGTASRKLPFSDKPTKEIGRASCRERV